MRILASNPDTIGDMVLREPMYRALRGAGHELMLVVRPSVAPVVRYLAGPGAPTLVLPTEVYRDDLSKHWGQFADLFAAARDFRPDVLLVAPYQWTQFEERLADELAGVPGLRRAGMSGRLYAGDPHAGHAPASRLAFDVRVAVAEDLPEAEKNAALAAAVNGRLLDRIDPRLVPDPNALDAARAVLDSHGLVPGGFWLACVTGTVNVSIKAWPADRWADVLAGWAARHGRRFLFVGLPGERLVAEDVRRLMGDRAGHAAVWMEGGPVDELIALASLSAGYVGHDTGPMHVAAAVGKPVLAVFGGGHRLRFFPRAEPSVSLTVGVACAGCGWACSFDASHCVKDVPAAEVARAADDLEAGRVAGAEARVLAPPPALLQQMVAESARVARDRLRRASALAHEMAEGDAAAGPARPGSVRADLARRAALLSAELAGREAAVAELNRTLQRVARESEGIARQLQEREAAVVDLRARVEDARAASAQSRRDADKARRAARAVTDEAESLREQVRRLERQVDAPTPPEAAARAARPWRQALADWVVGTRRYVPRRAPTPLPKVTLVIPVDESRAGDTADAHRRVDAVLAQRYPRLDLVLAYPGADGQAPPAATAPASQPAVRHVAAPTGGIEAIAKAFDTSDADVLGWLDAGETLEAGGLWVLGEYFRDHPRATAAYFEETADVGGWRVALRDGPRVGVYDLLAPDGLRPTAFYRRREYALLRGLAAGKGAAAGWDLLIRAARRYGLRRGRGHVVRRTVGDAGPVDATIGERRAAAFDDARRAFEESFGWLGRVRCRVVGCFDRLRHGWSNVRRGRPPDFGVDRKSLGRFPSVEASAGQAHHDDDPPVSPLTGRRPDRLLFTGRDTSTDDRRFHRVYHDAVGGVAIAHPLVDGDELAALYAAREAARPRGVVAPDGPSPYAGYRGGRAWERWLLRLPSPYWQLARWRRAATDGHDPAAGRVLGALAGLVPRPRPDVRVLNVGCYEGELLDRVRAATRWQTAGTETNARAAVAARAKGHTVWETSPQEAATAIPVGELFDVIVLPGVIAHAADPVMVLRRLRLLLAPGGWVVLSAPNLDGKPAEWFGPTWSGWQLPYRRVIPGRRGVRRMATAADLRVVRLRTFTDAYPAAVSAAQNELGLAGTIPEGAALPESAGRTGAQVAGWARLLWDWRGRGDTLYAVMKAL